VSSTPTLDHRYETTMWDSGRWSGFTPRDGDIVVCTSYKAGTTWTQMLCAVLIHQTPTLPAPLAQLSRWLDMRLMPVDDVLAGFEAQGHRRVIKTHTPLDGIPYFENVSYVYCGRDPRDIFMSMQHHMSNIDMDVQTFWRYRHLPNIHFHHFADLKKDLEGQMRRLAAFLEIEVDESKWPELVRAATFDQMKANADRIAPEADHRIWKSTESFFNKGENEQWRAALSKESLDLYHKLTRERYAPDMLEWMEDGSLLAGVPDVSGPGWRRCSPCERRKGSTSFRYGSNETSCSKLRNVIS